MFVQMQKKRSFNSLRDGSNNDCIFRLNNEHLGNFQFFSSLSLKFRSDFSAVSVKGGEVIRAGPWLEQ